MESKITVSKIFYTHNIINTLEGVFFLCCNNVTMAIIGKHSVFMRVKYILSIQFSIREKTSCELNYLLIKAFVKTDSV